MCWRSLIFIVYFGASLHEFGPKSDIKPNCIDSDSVRFVSCPFPWKWWKEMMIIDTSVILKQQIYLMKVCVENNSLRHMSEDWCMILEWEDCIALGNGQNKISSFNYPSHVSVLFLHPCQLKLNATHSFQPSVV